VNVLLAPAKVTLSLRVTGVRADGFHDIDAFAVSVDAPADRLVLEPAPVTSLRVTGPFAAHVPTDATNLVVRALARLQRTMTVELRKAIPAGAGLGGGSADAAAVLRAFGGSAADAATLGSDVPFCFARTPARVRGRGEILEPVTGLAPVDVVIVTPPFGCATPAVYRTWDDLGGPTSVRQIDAPAGYPGPLTNDLEPAAEVVAPELVEFRARVEAELERPALLCGSGSSYAAWFDDPDACDAAANRARATFDADRVWRATTIV
jgi:4-diphosphocytidyl-2-C-methyl-D-erythritol kinase